VFLTVIPTLWGVFFVALSWLFWNLGDVLAEAIIASERMIKGSINSQLTRFLMRLITFCLVVATLVIGGQSLGLPAYSIIASIGVGGLAVALAAQHTLANLLASLIIMFEKPFVIGSRVNVGGQAGTVSSVGFRSTQIQADGGAVISIPNDKVISGPIEADNSRPQNHISATLRVPNSTPVETMRRFVQQARDHLDASSMVKSSTINVGVSGLTSEGVDIHLEFILTGPFGDRVAERKNEILLELLELGAKSGILGGDAAVRRN
jgi:MscS family membrane protein